MDILNYSKVILEKVSFDSALFKKELKKSLAQLTSTQRIELIEWCRSRFQLNVRISPNGLLLL